MKQAIKLTLVLVGLVVSNSLTAQLNMHLETTSGTSSYLLDDVQVMTFTSTDMNVKNTSGVVTPYLMDDIVKIIFNNSVGVKEVNLLAEINVFPNPTTGLVTLNIQNSQAKEYVVNIYNVLGAMVKTIHFPSDGEELNAQLDFSDYTKGMYIMKVKGNEDTITRKIIVQ